jgi:hypothetical protein
MAVKPAVVTALAVSLASGIARAHPEPAPAGTNRYVTATVASDRAEIADAWLEGPLAAAEERRRLDADGDGHISASELARGRDAASAAALAVTLDGVAVPAATAAAIDLGGDAAVGTTPVAIERRMTLALGPPASGARAHALRIELVRDPPRAADTEVAIDLDPGWTLEGASAAGRAVFRGPRRSTLEDRSVTFTFVPATATGARAAAPGSRGVASVALLAMLAGAALAGVHRRSRRSPGARAVELGTHAAFPALVSTLLAYARPRLLPGAPPALSVAAAAGTVVLALWAAGTDGAAPAGHDEATVATRLVPSAEMLSLAIMGAFLPVALAAVGPATFGATLAARGAALPRAARTACALVAAIAAVCALSARS